MFGQFIKRRVFVCSASVLVSFFSLLNCSSTALAAQPALSKPSDWGSFYAGLMGGFFARNVRSDSVVGAALLSGNTNNASYKWSHGHYGWTAGAAVGYDFYDNYSVELGGFWSSKQQLTITSGSGLNTSNDSFCLNVSCFASGSTVSFHSWYLYTALRAQFLFGDQWFGYGKLGATYVHNSYKTVLASGSRDTTPTSIAGTYHGDDNLLRPLLSLGVGYEFIRHAWVGLDYTVVLGPHLTSDPYFNSSTYSVGNSYVPLLQMVMMSLNYRFTI